MYTRQEGPVPQDCQADQAYLLDQVDLVVPEDLPRQVHHPHHPLHSCQQDLEGQQGPVAQVALADQQHQVSYPSRKAFFQGR